MLNLGVIDQWVEFHGRGLVGDWIQYLKFADGTLMTFDATQPIFVHAGRVR